MPHCTCYAPPAHRGLDLIYGDAALLVVNKPAGLLSVPGRGADKHDSLATRVQAEWPDALVVHRLDMGTSGLLVLARGAEMQRRLNRLFRERQVEKRYIAVVAGCPAAPSGEIDLPLIADWPRRPRQKVDFSVGKPSLTRYRLLSHDPVSACSRLELEPVTGRSHQLRVHLQAIGHPILGDELYGDAALQPRAGRLLLHASALAFMHPLTQVPLRFESRPAF